MTWNSIHCNSSGIATTNARRPLPNNGARNSISFSWTNINAAQDKIIECLSRDGARANRFFVGDVKQSIYRFRLADPRIFQNYAADWRAGRPHAQTIPLADNFRSHEALLAFINPVFRALMRPEIGGVDYDDRAQLRFGAPEERRPLARQNGSPRVELHLRLTSRDTAPAPDDNPSLANDLAERTNAEIEARLVALRLRELKENSFPVWDAEAKQFRAVQWRDMVVLLRSPRNKAESYAREFARAGVPLEAERGGFPRSPTC
jgi:ATP-dependent helicase/nuclease subunit A